MAGKRGMKHYPRELKVVAIRMFFEERMTRTEIGQALELRNEQAKYPICGSKTQTIYEIKQIDIYHHYDNLLDRQFKVERPN